MTAKHAENVLSVPSSEIGNYNKSSSEDFSKAARVNFESTGFSLA